MSGRSERAVLAGLVVLCLAAPPRASLAAPARPETPAAAKGGAPLLPGAGSKQPVNIDADKLDYYDKEQKLIYTGNVVAVQGDSTLKASVLTIYLQKDPQGQAGPAPPPSGGEAPGPASGSSVKHMEADGPVTLISKDQIGTGDHATYDKPENKVYLRGHVTLSQGTNVTQGDNLIYDLTTGQAQVFSGQSNPRVKSVFTPGSGGPDAGGGTGKPSPKAEKPGARPKPRGKTATSSTAE